MTKMATTQLSLAELRQQNIRQTLNRLHNHASSILSLTHQWKEVEDGFQSTQSSIEERAKELQSMERSILVHYQQLELKEKELQIKEKDFELRQNLAIEDKCRVIEWIVESSKELKLAQESIEQHMEELEGKKKQLELINKSIDEELERKNKRFKLEVDIFKEDVQERYKVLDLKEKHLEERLKEVELKEKQFQQRCKEVELKEEKSATPYNEKSSNNTTQLIHEQDPRHPTKNLRRSSRNIRPYHHCSKSCYIFY